jgi:hypothetical protein
MARTQCLAQTNYLTSVVQQRFRDRGGRVGHARLEPQAIAPVIGRADPGVVSLRNGNAHSDTHQAVASSHQPTAMTFTLYRLDARHASPRAHLALRNAHFVPPPLPSRPFLAQRCNGPRITSLATVLLIFIR